MATTEQYTMLVLQIGGKNIGIPLYHWATFGDLNELEHHVSELGASISGLNSSINSLSSRVNGLNAAIPVCIRTNHLPAETSGLIQIPHTTLNVTPQVNTNDIGKTIIFGNAARIGIITAVAGGNVTVRLLQI